MNSENGTPFLGFFIFGLLISSVLLVRPTMSGPKRSIETIDVSDDGKLKVDVFFVRGRSFKTEKAKLILTQFLFYPA